MDLLSLSPSLLDILQFVEYKDVPNCQLVNRRIDNVIYNNLLTLPRPKVDIWLTYRKKKNAISLHVGKNVKGKPYKSIIWVYFTEGCTFLYKGNREIEAYYSCSRSFPENYEAIEKLKEGRSNSFNHKIYGNEDLASELKLLFSFISFRYHVKSNCIFYELPVELMDSLSTMFSQNRTRCDTLHLFERTPELGKLINSLDCREANLSMAPHNTNFLDYALEITSWVRPTWYRLRIFSRRLVTDIWDLLQKWQCGLLSLNKLMIEERSYGESYCSPLPNGAIETLKYELKDWIEAPAYTMEKHERELFVERPIDNRILIITYSASPEGEKLKMISEHSFPSNSELFCGL